jgi:hypothetical protein
VCCGLIGVIFFLNQFDMKQNSKALEFIYQDTQIHFLLGNEKNVMVNATEMAKAFGKRVDVFLKTDHAKEFIKVLELTPYGGSSDVLKLDEILKTTNGVATYFHRILALKFAAWLDPKFELWIYSTIENILFGHYKEHWEAHIRQEDAKSRMETARKKLLLNANQEDVIAYFKAEAEFNSAKNEKSKAIRNQYSLFENL